MRAAWRRFARQRIALVGLAAIAIILFGVIFGPMLLPYSPVAIDHLTIGYPQPPSAAHWLGTDLLGRDVLTRALVGGRVSITIGFTAMVVAIVFGTIYGAISGTAGGAVDAVMMRVVDALFSFPTFFLIITVEALLNRFALAIIVLILGLLSWMSVARLVRAEVLSLKQRDFVEAARDRRLAGASDLQAPDPQCARTGDCHCDLFDRRQHLGRGGALVSRARGSAADAVVGQHASGRALAGRAFGAVADRYAWSADRRDAGRVRADRRRLALRGRRDGRIGETALSLPFPLG
jgi:hypothetical protein